VVEGVRVCAGDHDIDEFPDIRSYWNPEPPRLLSRQMLSCCEKCEWLWREHAAAVASGIPLESKIRQAAIKRDFHQIVHLIQRAKAVVAAREESRAAIRRHELAVHAESAWRPD
jgi:hypothetical protein